MLEQGKTYTEINRETGLSRATIAAVSKHRTNVDEALASSLKSQESSDLTLRISTVLNSGFEDAKLAAMSTRDACVSAGILIDKRELLEGKPTARVDVSALDQDTAKLEAQLAALNSQLAALTGPQPLTIDVASTEFQESDSS